ncbi:MAG TPA: type II toxin-antitoxin system VapC family toxin, partial [Reyranella sp.]
MLVVDASIALTWCFEDEVTEATEAIGTRVDSEGAVVPDLWRLEVANALMLAERRGRLKRSNMEQRLELLAALPIAIDANTASRTWTDTLLLARAERLTLYDAAYLELAIRRDVELATLDRDLRRAARKMGVA